MVILFLTGTEHLLQQLKKMYTSDIVMSSSSKGQKNAKVIKVSGTVKMSGNLNGPTYCRLCGEHLPTYRAAFIHTSKLECQSVLSVHSLSCPIISCDAKIQDFVAFKNHIKESHTAEILSHIKYENKPLGMTTLRFRDLTQIKARTIIWQTMLFKKLLDLVGEGTKPFFPYIPREVLLSGTKAPLNICPYPTCVNVNAHEHSWETNNTDGKCCRRLEVDLK